jgi:hypothetical protein
MEEMRNAHEVLVEACESMRIVYRRNQKYRNPVTGIYINRVITNCLSGFKYLFNKNYTTYRIKT